MAGPLHYQTIAEIGRAYRQGALSPVEVTESQLDRIAALNPTLHAYVTVLADQARTEARAAEAALAAGWDGSPLLGVPIGLKDLIDVAGVVTTAGSTFYDVIAETDAPLVHRLRRAGAVILGKHQLFEFAGIGRHGTERHPVAKNPWALDRFPGGSSSGTGVAVAAGLCFAGIGSDTGGSIRMPAAYCGVVGLKPTYGLVPVAGSVPLAWSLDHLGPLTRSVEDAAIVLSALAGYEPADPWSAREAADDYLRHLDRGVRGLRIGLPQDLFFSDEVDPEVLEAVRAAGAVFEGLGADVIAMRLPEAADCMDVVMRLIRIESAAFHEPLIREKGDQYPERLRSSIEEGMAASAVDYLRLKRERQRLRAAILAAFDVVDLLLTPSVPTPAPPLEAMRRPEAIRRVAWSAPHNIAGIPTVSVPCGFSSAGLPIGMNLAGRPFDDALVLRAAAAYERATTWHTYHPPLDEGVDFR
ncbi:MAG: amidase [Dehalococcoidia bacterium]|nr:MAG: amidase [Dehalococcoidia bacterium]